MSVVRRTHVNEDALEEAKERFDDAVVKAYESAIAVRYWIMEYNFQCVHGDTDDFSIGQWEALCGFLNALFRVRVELSDLIRCEPAPKWLQDLVTWTKRTESGFNLAAVEKHVLGVSRPKRTFQFMGGRTFDSPGSSLGELISSRTHGLIGCDRDEIDGFVVLGDDVSPDKKIGPALCFGLDTKEPLLVPLFRDVVKFKRIDPDPLDLALCELSRLYVAIEESTHRRPQRNTGESQESKVPVIRWDKDLGELTLNGSVIRRVRRPKNAPNIVTILDVFQEEHWPRRVDSPFTSDAKRREAVSSLNDGLRQLVFEADGNEGIRWRIPDCPPL